MANDMNPPRIYATSEHNECEWREGSPQEFWKNASEYIRADLAAVPGEPVGVKALEWKSYQDSPDSAPRWISTHPFGEVRIVHNLRDGEFWSPEMFGVSKGWGTLAEAKAAVQADYEQRILSALTSPTPAAIEPAAWRWSDSGRSQGYDTRFGEYPPTQSPYVHDVTPLYEHLTPPADTVERMREALEACQKQAVDDGNAITRLQFAMQEASETLFWAGRRFHKDGHKEDQNIVDLAATRARAALTQPPAPVQGGEGER